VHWRRIVAKPPVYFQSDSTGKAPGLRNNPPTMAVDRPKFLAYARFLRLPNAITAMADPLAGWFAVGGGVPGWKLPLWEPAFVLGKVLART
jgi:hypothetical protein